jgi:translation initiation factor 1
VANSRLVYSTDFGRACPECGRPIAECNGTCRKQIKPLGEGIVRVRREVKGRQGKTVTTISGVPLDKDGLRELTTEFKRECGAGGSVKDGVIVIQGDHGDVLIPLLHKRGYTVKRAGG